MFTLEMNEWEPQDLIGHDRFNDSNSENQMIFHIFFGVKRNIVVIVIGGAIVVQLYSSYSVSSQSWVCLLRLLDVQTI